MKKSTRYEYYFRDNGKLEYFFQRYFEYPLLNRLPHWVRPNHFTKISAIMNLIALLIMITWGYTLSSFPFVFVCILFYLYFDCIDGELARRKGMETYKGEFYDHVGDIFGLSVVVFAAVKYLGAMAPLPYMLVTFLAFFYQYAFLEKQHHSNWAFFGPVGFLEAFFLLGIGILIVQNTLLYPLINTLLVPPFTLLETILLVLGGIGVFNFIAKSLIRGKYKKQFLQYVLALAMIGYMFNDTPTWLIFFFLLFYHLIFFSKVIFSHLVGIQMPKPEMISILMILAMFLVGVPSELIYIITLATMISRFIIGFRKKSKVLDEMDRLFAIEDEKYHSK